MKYKILLICTLLAFKPYILNAQQIDSGSALSAGRIQKALNDSKAHFKNGTFDNLGEDDLESLTTAPANSAQWHMECAVNLLRVAFSCKESGDDQTAQRVAKRALLRLERAEKLFAGDNNSLSSVYEIRGVIRERLVGDTMQALQCYQTAAQLNPGNLSAVQRVQLLQGAAQVNQ